MNVRPILFSAPMIRALLDGRKTQTRRVFKPQPPAGARYTGIHYASYEPDTWFFNTSHGGWKVPVRYDVGDLLWCRETWAHYQTVNYVRRPDGGAFDEVSDGFAGYRVDGHDTIEDFRVHIRLMSGSDLEGVVINGDRWRPSIHMPRWASRLTLEVTDVRVERLTSISEDDARAEGVEPPTADRDGHDWSICPKCGGTGLHGALGAGLGYVDLDCRECDTHRSRFRHLWSSIHGPDAWAQNPFVAALTFTIHHANVDELLSARSAGIPVVAVRK